MAMPERIDRWTLSELHRLPEDGNRYELVRGSLFVTPPPSYAHQRIASVLAALLQPYVAEHGLGGVCFPRSVVRFGRESEVEPDLMVRPVPHPLPTSWEDAPLPILVVEITSGATRRRDRVEKRSLYRDASIPEYWMIDGEARMIRVVQADRDDHDVSTQLVWHPASASRPFTLDVAAFFRAALGG